MSAPRTHASEEDAITASNAGATLAVSQFSSARHRDGSLLIESTRSHFDLIQPERVAGHLQAMLAELDAAYQGIERNRADSAKYVLPTAQQMMPHASSQPFFSPDGKWVAFFAQGYLQKVWLFPRGPSSPITGTPRSA